MFSGSARRSTGELFRRKWKLKFALGLKVGVGREFGALPVTGGIGNLKYGLKACNF